MAVPFEVERLQAQTHGAPAFLAKLVRRRVLTDRSDLTVAMTGVLLRMELVRRRGAPREAVMAGELLVHTRGRAIGTTVHRLDECQERDSFER